MNTANEIAAYVGAPEPELHARHAATRLRNLLRINSEFSAITGAIGLLAGGPVADLLGVDQVWLIRALGAGLLGFATIVFIVSGTRTSRLRRWSQIVSFNDLAWVAGTVAVIAMGWLSTAGSITMGLIGLVVLELGIAQMLARSRMVRAVGETDADLEESPPVEIIRFSRPATATTEELWPVITDHALYAKLALNLKAAENLTPNGPGFQRTCTDSVGRTWSETCTLWDPGRRFDVNVDISDYPYPLQTVQGSWRVDPSPGRRSDGESLGGSGSIIGMTFAIQPDPGVRGRLFVAMMHSMFTPILRRIARGWERAAPEVSTRRDTSKSLH